MKTITFPKFKNLVLSSLLFLFSITAFAQDTYKVVCDKTDKTIKVIKSNNRSPNYVPIKGGFPFQQVAQQWIDDNYTTKTCNPDKIVDQLKIEENSSYQTPVTNQNNQSVQQAQAAPLTAANTQEPNYRNTSFILNAKFSNIGEVFSLDKSMSPGFNIGFEQLFGKKYYVGIGVDMNFYFADFSSTSTNFDQMTFFFGKIPLFFGLRTYHKKYFFMYELGAEFNTEIQSSDDDFEFYGRIPNSNSFDIMARFRFGTERIMLSLGTEIWMTEIFENDQYKMTVFSLGMKFNF